MISAELSSASGVFNVTGKDAMRLKFISCASAGAAASMASAEVSISEREGMGILQCVGRR